VLAHEDTMMSLTRHPMHHGVALASASLGVAALLAIPALAQQGAQARRPGPPVLGSWTVPIGSLGHPLGAYLTVEGVIDPELSKTPPLRVDRVNGRKLREPVDITVENLRLPAGVRCVLKGYETARMVGRPPAVVAAAQEAGEEPPPGGAAAWGLHLEFIALKVVAPAGLDVPKRR
jgi:hypothetical protein